MLFKSCNILKNEFTFEWRFICVMQEIYIREIPNEISEVMLAKYPRHFFLLFTKTFFDDCKTTTDVVSLLCCGKTHFKTIDTYAEIVVFQFLCYIFYWIWQSWTWARMSQEILFYRKGDMSQNTCLLEKVSIEKIWDSTFSIVLPIHSPGTTLQILTVRNVGSENMPDITNGEVKAAVVEIKNRSLPLCTSRNHYTRWTH